MQYLSNDDLNYLSSQNQDKMNMVIYGMTSLMDETNDRIQQLESQTWFQRMSNTLTGKNKMTVNEIAHNRDKINVYLSEAISCLYDQNKISENIVLGLGNRLNELYAQQIEIKQMIGAFVSKLNQKISSIDNFHMLIEEINQGVYSIDTPIISICMIASKLDARTVHDSRKMEIILRAMEQNGLLSNEKVLFSDFLQELLQVSEADCGIIAMMFENAKEDYVTEIALKTVCQYYMLPDKIRQMKSRKSVVESVLTANQIDLEYAISAKEYYESLIEYLTNNILIVETQNKELEFEEKKKKLLDYFDSLIRFFDLSEQMFSQWSVKEGELLSSTRKKEWYSEIKKHKMFYSGANLLGSQYFTTLTNVENFIQSCISVLHSNVIQYKIDEYNSQIEKEVRELLKAEENLDEDAIALVLGLGMAGVACLCNGEGIIESEGDYYTLKTYFQEKIATYYIDIIKIIENGDGTILYDSSTGIDFYGLHVQSFYNSYRILFDHLQNVSNEAQGSQLSALFDLPERYPIIFLTSVEDFTQKGQLAFSYMEYTEAANNFLVAAEHGHAKAQCSLGFCYYTGLGVDEDTEKAFNLFSLASRQGEPEAQYWLAECYFDGVGTDEDEDKAYNYYSKSHKQNYSLATIGLAKCYYYGCGVEEDEDKAHSLLEEAAQNEDCREQAEELLAEWFGQSEFSTDCINDTTSPETLESVGADDTVEELTQKGIQATDRKDFEEAVKFFRLAADKGYADAQNRLGNRYSLGQGVKQDAIKAFEWFMRAAQQGHMKAQCNVGISYEKGDGVDTDLKQAFQWYLKSAKQGWAGGQYFLAECYHYGRGTTHDIEEAFIWYQKAAEQGLKKAQYELAQCYYYGRGTDEDEEKAVIWYQKAAEQGLAVAQYELAQCYYYGIGADEDEEEAVIWYRKAAEQGLEDAQYELAQCYYYGRGTDEDEEEAVIWYQEAAEQGLPAAQYQLAECYFRGTGIDEDNEKAYKYYMEAYEQNYSLAAIGLAYCYYGGYGTEEDEDEARTLLEEVLKDEECKEKAEALLEEWFGNKDPYISFEFRSIGEMCTIANQATIQILHDRPTTIIVHFNNMEETGTIHFSELLNKNIEHSRQKAFKIAWGEWVDDHSCELIIQYITNDIGRYEVKVWADSYPNCIGILHGM